MLISILSRYLLAGRGCRITIFGGKPPWRPPPGSIWQQWWRFIDGRNCSPDLFWLAYGPPSPWRLYGFLAVENLLSIPRVKQWLHNLGRDGVLIKDMAIRAFRPWVTSLIKYSRLIPLLQWNRKHLWACCSGRFFAAYANDISPYRRYLLAPTGIRLLMRNIETYGNSQAISWNGLYLRDIGSYFRTSLVYSSAGGFSRMSSLIRTIGYVAAHFQVLNVFWTLHSITQEEMTTDRAWTAVYIIRFLRNLVIHSQDSGKQAVHGAITEELVQSLPSIVSDIKIHIGNSAALETRRRIEEMWPTDRIFELRGVFRWVL